ncbi:protein mono-ADP-ribosyltransferase TIPARP-like [Xyrichtys novacula]|uniref:Protein mono-ADP-ribosyltransferase TIPARP-like n=1 Tax=Xyrichtys novacula TaxID=13765 RepID=A0AAV1F225_XYRNO|nr:protein mono-ADP-ribosyltransferase TIPARP-like [Xyrichtys novacula]
MSLVPHSKRPKRKMEKDVLPSEPPTKVTFLSQSHLLLEIPQNTNTNLPVWEAFTSGEVKVAWTVNPYSINVHVTPLPSIQEEGDESIITQPQPAVQPSPTTKKKVPPINLTPPATPTKRKTPPGVPARPVFHTKPNSDTLICDKFLLNLCHAGNKCKMHHTPYPFHWQLWAVSSHQWVDLPTRSQVLLERIYCNVNQENVFLNDQDGCYCLDFDSMELDDLSKYDTVRRLTNSDSLAKNQYFPSKLKIYWWDSQNWTEYEEAVSNLLLKSMREKKPECFFDIRAGKYKVDFTSMTQLNITTGYERGVRCRPVYRSPVSMQPFLRTGVQTGLTTDPPVTTFGVDPLEEFSSWYPPVWSPVFERDYSLVDVPVGSQAYQSVQILFNKSLPDTMVDIIAVQQVQNLLHWDKYQRHKLYMQKRLTKEEPLELHLFHGTTKEAAEDICFNNFDPRMAGVNGTAFGFGAYFATTSAFSDKFSAKMGPTRLRHMFLAKVLVGKVCLGNNSYRRPPPLDSKTEPYCLYDTCVDNEANPTMFVVFDSCQCYPYYLIKYKELPREIEIC